MKIEALYKIFKDFSNISTDTRKVADNSLFFALKGENFNGNKYAEEAIKKGALVAVIDNEKYKKNNKYIIVSNTLKCLQNLAKIHRTKSKFTTKSIQKH